jgi:glycosyltransferase involved in cell wall biosynthesis
MEPDLSKNIQKPCFSKTMKVLLLCNKSPYPQKEGGPIAMNMVVEGLLSHGHSVKVLAINSEKYNVRLSEIPDTYKNKTGIELVDVDLRVKPVPAFFNLFTGRSYHVDRFISEDFRARLIKILEEEQFDIIQLETLYTGPYIETIRKFSRAKIVLRAHNIEHLIWQRVAEESKNPLKRIYVNHLARTLKKFELSLIPKVDGIAAITVNDADYFENLERYWNSANPGADHHVPVITVPFGIDPSNYPVNEESSAPSLFSIGSMNWMPNEEGIRWFLEQAWPEIHNQYPDLKYYLAGRAMPKWMRMLDMPNVEIIGEVEDAQAFIRSKSIMIVPLFSGSGIRIKIIEGMAAARTIISTSLGAEGIHYTNGENILIANAPCEFFDMVSLCMEDRPRCRKIGEAARELIETEYNRDLIASKLISFYKELTA